MNLKVLLLRPAGKKMMPLLVPVRMNPCPALVVLLALQHRIIPETLKQKWTLKTLIHKNLYHGHL